MVLAIALGMVGGMLPINLAPYAVLISALIAGMYIGRMAAKPINAVINGIIACVIGGVLGGLITMLIGSEWITASTGISFLDSVVALLGGMLSPYVGAFAWFIAMGIILGAIGGFIGKKLKR
ncbi:MAG: hypothetical protein JW700_02605 [Candidatus Aenigmarchaeota archaeon]|nr:hypothetical protein [Candidatus Aenigmarchaeota archaeon]